MYLLPVWKWTVSRIKDLSIRYKLALLMVIVSFIVVSLVSAVFIANEYFDSKRALVYKIHTLARVTALNSTAALSFNDHKSVNETLSSLSVEPEVVMGVIYDNEGRIFGSYYHPVLGKDAVVSGPRKEGHYFNSNKVDCFLPVDLEGQKLGTVHLQAGLSGIYANLKEQVGIAALILVAALFISMFLAVAFQRVISHPLLHLLDLIREVTASKNYSVRASIDRDDEIGSLLKGFNNMLGEIQTRDHELEQHRSELEKEVALRTEDLRQSRHMLELVINNIPARVYWKNKLLEYIGCNTSFANDAQVESTQLIKGKRDSDLTLPEDRIEEMQMLDRRVITSGIPQLNIEEETKDAHGSVMWLSNNRIPLRDKSGEVVGLLGVYEDITAKKQVEETLIEAKDAAEAAVKAKSEFLANMSHEVRTPMNGVLGALDLVVDTEMTSEQREYIELAHRSGRALLRLIDDILDFSKIDAGKMLIRQTPFDVRKSIFETLAALEIRAAQRGLELVSNISDEVPQVLIGDMDRIRQIIVNLVGNAIKFTPRGGGLLFLLETEESSSTEVKIHISVGDSGIGIPQEKLDNIFDSFSQVDASTTRAYGGTGLGLSICYQLTQLMGGTIWVVSKEGVGSTFHVILPLQIGSRQDLLGAETRDNIFQEESFEPRLDSYENAERPIHVLLVEDNFVNQKLAVRLLVKKGFQVTVCGNGREALEMINKNDFDLILMDCQMPVMDGYEATSIIRYREKESHRKHIPIIAMTARAMEGDKERCLASGMDDYVSKPLNIERLFQAINKALKREGQSSGNNQKTVGDTP